MKKSVQLPKGKSPAVNHEDKCADTKGEITSRKSKDRQYTSQNSNLQNIMRKNKDRAARTPLNLGGERKCSGNVSTYCFMNITRRVTLVTNPVISHEWHSRNYIFGYKYCTRI